MSALRWVAANIAEDKRFIATAWITTSFLLAGVIGQWIGGALGISGSLYALGGAYLVLGGIIATFPEVPVTVRRSFAENLARMPGLIVAARSGPYFATTLVALGVFALTGSGTTLGVGGDFTRIGGRSQQGFAEFVE